MIVAFTGLAGSGKSTAAHYLVKHHGFVRTRFADTLKAMMRTMGLSDAEIDGELKEKPSAILMGKTPRWAMQSLGTEWGRNCINTDIWVALWQRTALDIVDHGGKVVVDDCRFENEYRMVKSMGGLVCKIVRAGAGTASRHVSENGGLPYDALVENDKSIAELHEALAFIGMKRAAA